MLNVKAAAPADLDEVVALLEEAGTWLWQRGIRQWEPGSHLAQRPRLVRDVDRGRLLVARIDAALAACVVLDPEPNPVWSDRPGAAAYVYKLAVSRAFAGRGLGREMLGDCESRTAESGLPLLRLDCWAGNSRLRAYYEHAGFISCGEADEHGARVARFEKDVSSALESPRAGE